ncbi:unnamed protein product, partial [Protopolystoma xenopodis]
ECLVCSTRPSQPLPPATGPQSLRHQPPVGTVYPVGQLIRLPVGPAGPSPWLSSVGHVWQSAGRPGCPLGRPDIHVNRPGPAVGLSWHDGLGPAVEADEADSNLRTDFPPSYPVVSLLPGPCQLQPQAPPPPPRQHQQQRQHPQQHQQQLAFASPASGWPMPTSPAQALEASAATGLAAFQMTQARLGAYNLSPRSRSPVALGGSSAFPTPSPLAPAGLSLGNFSAWTSRLLSVSSPQHQPGHLQAQPQAHLVGYPPLRRAGGSSDICPMATGQTSTPERVWRQPTLPATAPAPALALAPTTEARLAQLQLQLQLQTQSPQLPTTRQPGQLGPEATSSTFETVPTLPSDGSNGERLLPHSLMRLQSLQVTATSTASTATT